MEKMKKDQHILKTEMEKIEEVLLTYPTHNQLKRYLKPVLGRVWEDGYKTGYLDHS